MKLRILAVCTLLLASLFFVFATPVSAEPNYDQLKYDPKDDVLRVRQGDFRFDSHDNVEITKMTSSYVPEVIPKIELTMTVEGTITKADEYKYVFAVTADKNDYIFAAWNQGAPVGFEMGSSKPIPVDAEGEGTDTLKITFNVQSIGNPSNSFEFSGGAVYSVGDYEKYLDLARPDKLVLITKPSDGSTVSGTIDIKGVIRDSIDGQPSGTVKIKIDSGDWEDVTGSDSWSYPNLDTTTLSAGKHTIAVKVDGSELENVEDDIEITVDQNTGGYKSLNEKPSVHVGDEYNYTALEVISIGGINLDLSNQMDVGIEDLVTITVDGTEYETYKMHTRTEGGQDFGYASFTNQMDRTSWREKNDLSSVKDYTISIVDATSRPETTVETTTTYDPPLENHNYYDITVGYDNIWHFSGSSHSESQTTVNDDTTQNPTFNEDLDLTGECLYYLDSINVHGNTFEEIYVIRTFYENPGVSIVEYYSKDLGMAVRIDTFDPSRELLVSMGLERWEQMPFSVIIEDITFNPAQPQADTTNKVTINVRNIGGEEAKNIKVTVRDGTRQVAQETISSIAMDTSEPLTVDWTPESEGNHSIKVTVSTGSNDLDEKTVYVDVKPGEGGDGYSMFMILLLIIVIIIVAVVLVVVLLARKKKPEGEVPAAAEGQEAAAPPEGPGVVVATEEVAAEPVQPAVQPAAVQAAPAATQMFQENIKCPSCQNAFTVNFQSKPVRVKCPSCGTEGVLN